MSVEDKLYCPVGHQPQALRQEVTNRASTLGLKCSDYSNEREITSTFDSIFQDFHIQIKKFWLITTKLE